MTLKEQFKDLSNQQLTRLRSLFFDGPRDILVEEIRLRRKRLRAKPMRQMLGNRCHCYKESSLIQALSNHLTENGLIRVSAARVSSGRPERPQYTYDSDEDDSDEDEHWGRSSSADILKIYIIGSEHCKNFHGACCTLSLGHHSEYDSATINGVQYQGAINSAFTETQKTKQSG